MDVSIFLAKALGLYLIIFAVPLLVFTENFISILSGIFHNASIQFVLGIYVLTMGILLVLFHSQWDGSWTVLITILAWLTLAKGILYVVFPKVVHSMSHVMVQSRVALRINALISLLIGIYLVYMGFFAS